MNLQPRFIGRFLFILAWLFFISLPIFAFTLAIRRQIQFGNDENSHLRIFILQEEGVEGVGIEFTRPFSKTPQCNQTNVRYFMWTGSAENAIFCHCYDSQDNSSLPAVPGVCNPP